MDLRGIDAYCDVVPRAVAEVERVGPFKVFVAREAAGHPFYARPSISARAATFSTEEVLHVLQWQRDHGLPPSIEWIDEVTPGLHGAVVAAVGEAAVEACPLLALAREVEVAADPANVAEVEPGSGRVEVLSATSPRLGEVAGAVAAAFADTDEVVPHGVQHVLGVMKSGELVVAGAFDASGAVVGGASASPRGEVAEISGIGVLPRGRRQGFGEQLTRQLVVELRRRGVPDIFLSAASDQAAALYRRIGFARVGTACVARAREVSVRALGPGDWRVFRELRLRALAESPDAFGAQLADVMDRPDALWQERVTGPGPILAAYDEGVPVAIGGAFPRPDEGRAMIWGMWVDPAARGRGHARRLLTALVGWVRDAGFPVVDLHVTEGNDEARRLYVAAGFTPTGDWESLRDGSPLQIELLRRPLK